MWWYLFVTFFGVKMKRIIEYLKARNQELRDNAILNFMVLDLKGVDRMICENEKTIEEVEGIIFSDKCNRHREGGEDDIEQMRR